MTGGRVRAGLQDVSAGSRRSQPVWIGTRRVGISLDRGTSRDRKTGFGKSSNSVKASVPAPCRHFHWRLAEDRDGNAPGREDRAWSDGLTDPGA